MGTPDLIFITGASSGIGEACAEAFAARGKHLMLTARRADRLRQIAARLEKAHSVRCQAVELDVSDREAVAKFSAAHSAELERVSVLINNAGGARGLDPIQSGSLDDWDEMIDTNVKGLLYLTREVLPRMIARGRGHVVNLGSVAARWVYPKGNVYCASKAAVAALTQAMRLDLSGTPIRVTEISPGMVETEFALARLKDEARAKAVYAGLTPLSARDVAESVLWCVERPAHVNVQELVLYPTDQASTTVVSRRG
jgi:3-hydroxy acid dehydrogenase / malonic semialdehyde reductase